jgi:RimJ/RimL family protein N-acetyltransferase
MSQWQPTLTGALIRLRPLKEEDFESLYAAGSDPLLWEQHPDRERYTRARFELFFRTGMESKGALVVIDQKAGKIIGSSRFAGHDVERSMVEVGYTFVSREYWGAGYNRELKFLMLNYAFQFCEVVQFVVGEINYRSQTAVKKIGAKEIDRVTTPQLGGDLRTSVVYEIKKSDWPALAPTLVRSFDRPSLVANRLVLEPVRESHSDELWELFRDPELHHFVPFEPLSLEKQKERCIRWATGRSPDGTELWLNWVGRDKLSKKAVAHFQAGVKADGIASIGYLVSRDFQRKGIATEGLMAVFKYLREGLAVKEVRAWSDTRNHASHRLAEKLGMVQVQFVKDADFFKGATSDEFVFSKKL